MKFSKTEIKDLLLAWLMISLAFAVLFSGGLFGLLDYSFLIILLCSALTAGLGFLLHELMHKKIAQSYGLWAEFRAFYPGLFLAIAFSFLGFIFAAPGAVVSKSYRPLSIEKRGKISIAGPLTNIILALLFLIGALFFRTGFSGLFFSYGLTINSLLGAFNLIPARPFDGSEVYLWNKKIYFVTLFVAVTLFIITFFI